MDAAAIARAFAESDESFREQFDRSSPNFHGGIDTAVPVGGSRVPESMKGAVDWRDLPDAPIAIEPEYPPEYHAAMACYEGLNKVKKAMNTLNKPVETVMKVRFQYKEAPTEEDKTALLGRLKGEEANRDGSLNAMQALLDLIDPAELSDRTNGMVKEVVERGKFEFEDKDTFGEYMTTLQRCNQAIFADQKKLLAKIKEIKKASRSATAPKVSEEAPKAPADAAPAGA